MGFYGEVMYKIIGGGKIIVFFVFFLGILKIFFCFCGFISDVEVSDGIF